MKLKCACGRVFEVPDGTQSAKCPACGKPVRAAEPQDWLQGVDMDALSLEAPPAEEAPPAATAPKAAPPAPGAAPAGGKAQPSARERNVAQSAAAASRRQSAPAAKAPKFGAPQSMLDLLNVLRQEPAQAAPLLRDGVTAKPFMIQMGVGLAVLGLVGTTLLSWDIAPMTFGVRVAVTFLLKLLFETAAAGAMLSLVAVGLKRECRPLGVVEAVVFARILALILLIPLGLVLAVIGAVLASRGEVPLGFLKICFKLPELYVITVALAQSGVTMGLFKLGCGGSLVMSAVAVYAGSILAQTIFGAAGF